MDHQSIGMSILLGGKHDPTWKAFSNEFIIRFCDAGVDNSLSN